MKIILSGYGRMGREIEKVALARGHEIAAIIDNETQWLELDRSLKPEMVIDFSEPSAAAGIIKRSLSWNLPVVTGTTGWYDDL